MRTCQHCHELVEDDARTHCPHCGVVLSKTQDGAIGGGHKPRSSGEGFDWDGAARKLDTLGAAMVKGGIQMTVVSILVILVLILAVLLL